MNLSSFFLWPGSWRIALCDESIVILSGSLAAVSFDIKTVAIVGVSRFAICVFAPECAIDSIYFLVELGGVPILLIKLILGGLILVLFIIGPNRHLRPFLLTPILFL